MSLLLLQLYHHFTAKPITSLSTAWYSVLNKLRRRVSASSSITVLQSKSSFICFGSQSSTNTRAATRSARLLTTSSGGVGTSRQYTSSTFFVHSLFPHFGFGKPSPFPESSPPIRTPLSSQSLPYPSSSSIFVAVGRSCPPPFTQPPGHAITST